MTDPKMHVSWETFSLAVGGSALLVIFATLALSVTKLVPTANIVTARALLSDTGAIVFDVFAAIGLFFAAGRFPRTNPLRHIWMLLAMGISLYALGDMLWVAMDVGSHFTVVPYPSVADAAYLSMYVFMVMGLAQAARAFSRVVDVERVLKADIIVMFVISILVYTFVAAPIIVAPGASLAEKALGVAYPIGDLVALLGPASFIAVVASLIGSHQPVRQWWVLAAGLAVMSASDIAFTWLDWNHLYASGSVVDYLWMIALLLIALSGSMAADICSYRPGKRVLAAPSSRRELTPLLQPRVGLTGLTAATEAHQLVAQSARPHMTS